MNDLWARPRIGCRSSSPHLDIRHSSRVIVDLIETGLEAREQEKKQFFELADRLVQSSDTSEQKRLKAELARLTFGE